MGKRKSMVTMDDTRITEREERLKTPAKRPFWQAGSCPGWCMSKDSGHNDRDAVADRHHISRWEGEVTLTTESARWDLPRDGHPEIVDPVRLVTYLIQGYREIAPRLELFVENKDGGNLHLTVTEARKLRNNLDKAIALAESAM